MLSRIFDTFCKSSSYKIKHVNIVHSFKFFNRNIPSDYTILFMAGGGTGQFAAVPLNLMSSTGKAVYLNTGTWSSKAAKEASKYGQVIEIKPDFKSLSNDIQWDLDEDVSYFYYCANETVHGIELHFIPDTYGIPLVADMSSNILTKDFDIKKVCHI